METTAETAPVVLLPTADETGHELACSVCSARTAVRPGTPMLAQIRVFTAQHAH